LRKRGFTLVEIMIVILIIGILLSIAVPQWVRLRERSTSRACSVNLREMDSAKQQFAMENNLSNGASCTMADLWPTYIRASSQPTCPSGGVYTVGNVSVDPACSYVNPLFPHVP